jgi:hypothetical protein
MTGSTTNHLKEALRTCLVAAFLGTLLWSANPVGPGSRGFSVDLRVEQKLFHLRVSPGTLPSEPNGIVRAG